MAGKKLNEAEIATTMADDAYVAVVDENGKTIRIKKTDFAKAIVAALPVATSAANGAMSSTIAAKYRSTLGKGKLTTNYGYVNSHKLSLGAATSFLIFQPPFSDSASINAVTLIVHVHYKSTGTVYVSVKTTGGISHPMNSSKCSIAYKVEDSLLNVYIPVHNTYGVDVQELFSKGTVVLSEEGVASLTDATLISTEGIN